MKIHRHRINPIDVALAVMLPITTIGLYVEFFGPPTTQEIIEFALNGDFEQVEPYLDEDFDFAARGHGGSTLLHAAAGRDNQDLAIEILRHGGGDLLNLLDDQGYTPAHRAIGRDHSEEQRLLRIFVDDGVDINSQTKAGESLLAYAIRQNNPQAALALLKKGADADIDAVQGQSTATYIIERDMDFILEPMFDAGLRLDSSHTFVGITPLELAVGSRQTKTFELLLKYGSNPNKRWAGQWTWIPSERVHLRTRSFGGDPPDRIDIAPVIDGEWILELDSRIRDSQRSFGLSGRGGRGGWIPQITKEPIRCRILPLDFALMRDRSRALLLMEHGARAKLFPRLLTTAVRHQ